jgi:hypothetical protein
MEAIMLRKSKSAVDALDDFAALAGLFINFGGSVSELFDNRSVWQLATASLN